MLKQTGLLSGLMFLAGCGGGSESLGIATQNQLPSLRVYNNPYAEVDWATDLRLKGQHHDHPGLKPAELKAYDDAGYAAVSLMDYSGAYDLPYALKARLWPPQQMLPADLLSSFRNIKIFIPNGEEVGLASHVTSSFLESYIDRWNTQVYTTKQSWQYMDLRDLYSVIRSHGGLPILAHPWNEGRSPADGVEAAGVEIYSAFAEARKRSGFASFTTVDRNEQLLKYWDQVLAIDPTTIGIAVNDHFGPLPAMPVDPDIRDSGKIVVFAKEATLQAYRSAFEKRAILAIRDSGQIKGRFPEIASISVQQTSILVDTAGTVRWIANGVQVGHDNLLEYRSIPQGSTYLRAEVRNADGVVFTQAFTLRPVGDVDGDGVVNAYDQSLCVSGGANIPPLVRVDACNAAGTPLR